MNEFYKNLIAYAVQKDVRADELTGSCGIDWSALKAGRPVTVSIRQSNDLWRHAVRLSGDPLFGLHLGESMQLTALGLVGSVIRNSATVGEALDHCAAFSDQVSGLFATRVSKGREAFTIELVPDKEKLSGYPVLQKHLMELSLAFILHELDGLLFTKIKPLSVEMPYDKNVLGEVQRVLRCGQIRPGKRYRMAFSSGYWEEPVVAADFALQQVLLQRVRSLRAEAGTEEPLSARIRGLLAGNSYLGAPTLKEMAANLNMSTRSLQRRLSQEGVSYGELAESVRQSMATHYLQGGVYPLKEISYLLGYNELSSFSRAFKKWTGRTPQAFRKQG